MNERTLVIETSTSQGSLALFDGENLVRSESFAATRSHSARLFVLLEQFLADEPRRPGTIVVGLGPGSYAGVRIAIAAAIGLGLATGARLVGLSSLAGLGDGSYLALGDARRDTFYFATVREGAGIAQEDGPRLLDAETLAATLASETWRGWPIRASEPLAIAPGAEIVFPCAQRLGRLALAGKGQLFFDQLEPIYLREAHITRPKKPSK
ncbi:MAG TPA: tRNA (adenosine(37)-N6)-threonylcarbamoyltransferase complex dimerization subunit type 1 TsaB [Chthoniobacteraceae bacterium]|nr:tRNA (adenosine(37)-N6)-threonylcarbamoyltransferase complex dimerization subunit type 1 TsaB [Chthoniobacteraceae bacterium]